jgi:hypothetical protein
MPEHSLIVDYRTPEEERLELRSLGFRVVLSEPLDFLYEAVKGHPDLQFVNACGTLICHKGIAPEKSSELNALGIQFTRSRNPIAPPYPGHIILNAAISDDLLIHRLSDTDPAVLDACPSLKRVDVRQGYTRCSLAYVGEDSYVTSDTGISRALRGLDKNVLLLPEGDVHLEGFSHGFIGGCLSRVTYKEEKLLLVTGSLDSYRYGQDLRAFLRNIGIGVCSIGSGSLKDRGSIIQI